MHDLTTIERSSPFLPKRCIAAIPLVGVALFMLVLAGREVRSDEPAVTSEGCLECHDTAEHEGNSPFPALLDSSVHAGFGCLDCHTTITSLDHEASLPPADCGSCHDDVVADYQWHGGEAIPDGKDVPGCADCHGQHRIKAATDSTSMTHRRALTQTCGRCHSDIDLVNKHELLNQAAVDLYEHSVHGTAVAGGNDTAATCIDCHGTGGNAHRILIPGNPESAINHFNIPATCGTCHREIARQYETGIHGKLVKRGETGSPVCTNCHGEHGIIPPRDPRSPVSSSRVAEATCSPCHESAALNDKYSIPTGRLKTWVDSYHGLKSQSGDVGVANCASCHGAHQILPSSDSLSSIHASNLQSTCGSCHPGITATLAATTVHGEPGVSSSPVASIVESLYIFAIIAIVGFMAAHGIIDFRRQMKLARSVPQVRRMNSNEVAQHWALMISFIVLVITGFALRFSDAWWTQLLFGWEGGAPARGTIHRVAAVVLIGSSVWHLIYLFSPRGRQFIRDIWVRRRDLDELVGMIRYNLGLNDRRPQFGRFSYVEKAEYWALIWGTIVMAVTGLMLWFDNTLVRFMPRAVLDVMLVIHFYEAVLASLAILVWHLYSVLFSPAVYPMNPAWLTGKMPQQLFEHEHPDAEPDHEEPQPADEGDDQQFNPDRASETERRESDEQ